MKDTYVCDFHTRTIGSEVTILGWIYTKRHHGKIIFLDVCDSTGTIQAVVEEQRVGQIQFNLVTRYEFVRDVHRMGCVPHAAFGMGVERMIRWLLNIPHVRDAIPFPRMFRRKILP